MKSIFQALDGGHLDRALFSSGKSSSKTNDDDDSRNQDEAARRFGFGRGKSRRIGERDTRPPKHWSEAD